MLWFAVIVCATLFIAYANGANDNFKGVATLFGSGTAEYRKVLAWATVTTLAGSVTAAYFATTLVKTFSGKGLVPDVFLQNPAFLAAVILGAGITVFATAMAGIPISTTHSLTGALVGAGLVAVGGELGFATLGNNFFKPLLLSPFFSIALAVLVYPLFKMTRMISGSKKSMCVCIGEKTIPVQSAAFDKIGILSAAELKTIGIEIDETEACEAKSMSVYGGRLFGIEAQAALDFLHFLSAGAVSFARGLNDTPKIVALSVAAGAAGLTFNVYAVAALMAIGGLIGAKRIAETMSHKITGMNAGQGFTANLVTAFLVIFASKWGMPVSTTHVSCGSLFGIGLINGKAHWKMVAGIISSWVLTLPVAAGFSAVSFWILRNFNQF